MQTAGVTNLKMNTVRRILNKKGSYLVETTIALPIFLIAVITMSSVILMYACIEDSNFIMANELRKGASEAILADTNVAVPYRVKKELESKHSLVKSTLITDFGYRVNRWDTDELIALSVLMTMKSNNPIGIKAKAEYEVSLVTRAYVGRYRGDNKMSADEFMGDADAVYIFPKRGERYHNSSCRHLKAASRSGVLTSSIKKQYKSCPLCKSGKASMGTLIYYFPAAGEDYHLRGCPSLQRNYVEVDKKTAKERGYTACGTCGG